MSAKDDMIEQVHNESVWFAFAKSLTRAEAAMIVDRRLSERKGGYSCSANADVGER